MILVSLLKSHINRKIIPSFIRHYIYHYYAPVFQRFKRVMYIPFLFYNYLYDFQNFLRWSSVSGTPKSQNQLKALIVMDYHRIEKGLALKEPRPGFGSDVVQRLLDNLLEYSKKYGSDRLVKISLNVLLEYLHFNSKNGFHINYLREKILDLKSQTLNYEFESDEGGIVSISRESVHEKAKIDLSGFFDSRHSIRNFSHEEVSIELLKKAVKMAQKTPSVCNRQSSKVYVFSKKEDKEKVLSYQNGNRGFGCQADKILIIVSSLESFTSIGERNQCWIDGGMFAMSIVYALHSLGIGTCCLNWSVEHWADRLLKKASGIKESESVLMMIAVGNLPEKLNVAQSPRKEINEVIEIK